MTVGGGQPEAAARGWDPLASGSANLFWAKIGGNGGYFVAVLIVARGLGPAGRGTVAFITVAALVVAHMAGLGVGEATTVLSARHPARRPVLLANALVYFLSAGLTAGTLAFLGLLLSGIEPAGVGTPELVILAFGIVSCAVGEAGYSFLIGVERLRQLAFITGCASWVYAGLVFVLWAGPGLTVGRAALAWTATEALRAGVLMTLSRRGTIVGLPDRRLLVEEIGFGLRLWVGSLARFLNFRTDQILMGFLTTETALGFYAVAVNVSEVLLYLPSSAATALLPLIARTEPAGRGQETLRAFRSVIFVTGAGVAVAALVGPFVLPAVFRLRDQCRLLERPRRVVLTGPVVPGADGVARRRVRPRPRADPALRRDRGRCRGQRGVPGRRCGRAAHVSPRQPVPVADDARPSSRRPRRAGRARRPIPAGAPSP